MPPSKGRMLGLKGGGEPVQNTLDFRAVKNLGLRKKNTGFGGKGRKACTAKNIEQDEGFQKLRIPTEIGKALPSVKKFSGSKAFVDITEDSQSTVSSEDAPLICSTILGAKKGRGQHNKYQIRLITESKFNGMIWDIAFASSGDVLVSCGDGVLLCDSDLTEKTKLENIRLAGGVDFLSDGRIVAVCRFTDTVNIYNAQGAFLSSFIGGDSPMTVIVNGKDEVIVADPGVKEIHMFTANGKKIRSILTEGPGYNMKWPLYMTLLKGKSDMVVVSDCHRQEVLMFDQRGRYLRSLQLKTFGGNEVLRPHGLCSTLDGDLLIVDNAIDSVEVFKHNNAYLQTLVPSSEGSALRPKVLRCSSDGCLLAIGGMKGHVQLFELLDCKPVVKETMINIKQETPTVKTEPGDVIVLD